MSYCNCTTFDSWVNRDCTACSSRSMLIERKHYFVKGILSLVFCKKGYDSYNKDEIILLCFSFKFKVFIFA